MCEERLLDVAAGKLCDRGYSLADCLMRTDEGSAGGPAMPTAVAELRDATKVLRFSMARHARQCRLVISRFLSGGILPHVHCKIV